MLTSPALAFSRGNPFPVDITLTSPRGDTVTGLAGSLTGGVALAKGGAVIASPDTALGFTEATTTPSTARVYRALITISTVNALLTANPSVESLWVVVTLPGGLEEWAEFPVQTYRVAS